MKEYTRKTKKITFEADEDLFAEFIAWRKSQANLEFVGYFIKEGSFFSYYSPIRETDAIEHYRKQMESLESTNKHLEEKNSEYYHKLQKIGKTEVSSGGIKNKRKWF